MKKRTSILLALALTVSVSGAPGLPAAHAADSAASIVNGTAKTVSYDAIGGLSEGLAFFWNAGNKLYGYTNTDGKTVIKAQFDEVKPFSEGLAAVRKGKLWGFVDKKGKIAIKPQYERVVEGFNGGLAAVKKSGGKWNYIDKTGKTKLTAAYDEVHEFKDGMAVVWKRKGSAYVGGFIDLNGKEVVKPQYAMLDVFSEGLAPVMKNGKWGYIDKKGKTVIKPQFDGAAPFSEGLALFLQNGKYGYVNAKSKIVVKAQYTGGQAFSEGRAAVKVGGSASDRSGKWGYIGATGKLVIPAQYSDEGAEVGSFKEGIAFVQRQGGNKILIDRFGKAIVDLRTNDITVGEFEGGAAVVNAPVGQGHYYFMKNPLKK
ncbi:WG repeat-containing protein [Saccharibacillus alkalitolerans]|uniref:WG repeat-containing protein n=1 Tax=Saccharibacillus alkalitolerans TaxID=2705290 RepID=A0ABX0F528_9BACL|nr:WG repeat-containing protein [Saccharibacillus alkalitolerans]NGZ75015.1 WG repeat-containing protein [Saccharibacillus alkalitolerans]